MQVKISKNSEEIQQVSLHLAKEKEEKILKKKNRKKREMAEMKFIISKRFFIMNSRTKNHLNLASVN